MQQKNIGILKAYGAFWKQYADFSSRTSKEAFWKAFFIQSVLLLAMLLPTYYVYESIIERNDISAGLWLLPLGLYSIATVVPTIAIIIRRLHDIDRNGCWFFLYLVPFVGLVIFFIMLSRPSAPFDVYPGRSGAGPYTGSGASQYYWQQQYQYYQPQNPYSQTYVYAPPQNPYYQRQAQYAPPPNPYYQSLPSPRLYAPQAGGNNAAAAIILSIIVTVASTAYSYVCSDYMQKNLLNYFDNFLNDSFVEYFDGFYNNPFYGEGDPWNDGDHWEGETPWNDIPGFGWNGEGTMSEDELAAIDLVRGQALEGFPDFSIEEVILTRVEEDSLEWDCFSEEGGEYPAYYVCASGRAIGDFVYIYIGFDVYDDYSIVLYNLDDGVRDEYYEEARDIYREWYTVMLSGIDNSTV